MNDCEHPKTNRALRRRDCSNGSVQYVGQCLMCGQTGRAVAHNALTAEQKAAATPVDKTIAEAYWKALHEERRLQWESEAEERRNQRAEEHAAWTARHAQYLAGPEWRAKKDLVFRRDGYVCQACLEAPAQQVHHETPYRYPLGKEPLWTLHSVCSLCHERITRLERELRGEGWMNEEIRL